MDISQLKQILTSFADEPADVDVRSGKITAQIRDDIIEANLSFDENQSIFIEENGVRLHWRPWIVQRVAKLPQLADRIISAGKASPLDDGSRPFVAPKALYTGDLAGADQGVTDKLCEDATYALVDAATTVVPGATSILYLTSDAGEGKTTLIKRVALNQALQFKEKKVSSLIVPIPLSGRSFLTFDDAVIAALSNQLRFGYYYYDAFLHLVKLGAIVPAFDGYEEMLVEGSKGEAVSALGNLVQSLQSSGSVIIAARKAFFEYLSFRTQARLLDAIGDRSAVFGRLQLQRWDKDLFCKYGDLRGVKNPASIYETVAARLDSDHPLLTRAVLVSRLFDVIESEEERDQLATKLGSNPHDYFYTFVDTIVQREAGQKWLALVAGEVREPLLTKQEHHALLASFAQEMWQASTGALRYDVVDVLVDLFTESKGKPAYVNRQVKERIRQHSLLSANSLRGMGLSFDHEDFQAFYLGESLGLLLAGQRAVEIRTFLQVNSLPHATVEQSVQYLERHDADLTSIIDLLASINRQETGFTFSKQNCSALMLRIAEVAASASHPVRLERLILSAGSLEGRSLSAVSFISCELQPTGINGSTMHEVRFVDCEFERLEIDAAADLRGIRMEDCRIASLAILGDDVQSFDPRAILQHLRQRGVAFEGGDCEGHDEVRTTDDRTRAADRFFRAFTRRTYVDESVLKLKAGRVLSSILFDDVLPRLIADGVIGEIPWTGQGVQRRFKLLTPMTDVYTALEIANGDFDVFAATLKAKGGAGPGG